MFLLSFYSCSCCCCCCCCLFVYLNGSMRSFSFLFFLVFFYVLLFLFFGLFDISRKEKRQNQIMSALNCCNNSLSWFECICIFSSSFCRFHFVPYLFLVPFLFRFCPNHCFLVRLSFQFQLLCPLWFLACNNWNNEKKMFSFCLEFQSHFFSWMTLFLSVSIFLSNCF